MIPQSLATIGQPVSIQLDQLPQAYMGFTPSQFLALEQLPQLPPVSACCYRPPKIAPALVTHNQVQLPTEERLVELNDEDVQTIVRENSNYTKFDKTIVTTVNRRHTHTKRVVNNENVFNTYVTNNLIKVNDIHRNRVENVKGETKVKSEAKQTVVVEPAKCVMIGEDGSEEEVAMCGENNNNNLSSIAFDQQQQQQQDAIIAAAMDNERAASAAAAAAGATIMAD